MDFSKFEDHFKQIDSEIKQTLSGEPESLYNAAGHIIFAGGKRIRPLLCLLSCQALGGKWRNAVKTAAAVELIHTFTLIHDDLMDRDHIRRGVPSVHEEFGEPTAILAGDLLFSRAFEICDPKTMGVLARASSEICEGQELDMRFEQRFDVSESEYLEMIRKKTAVLLEAATRSGAILCQSDEKQINGLAVFGLCLGMAFQIHDDILGVTADEEKLGKPVGSDIIEGKKNLVMIKTTDFLEGREKHRFIDILKAKDNPESDITEAIGIIKDSGSIQYCMNKGNEFMEGSLNSIKELPDTQAKKDLAEIAEFVIKRDN